MGLVDELAPSTLNLAWMARKAIDRKRKSKSAPLWKDLLRMAPARGLLAKKFRAETAKKVREEHYPAPFRLIDLFETHAGNLEGMKVGGDARLRAADGGRHLQEPAPRVQALGDDEGAGAQEPRLQAAARARDRRRRDGRRHRRLVRRLAAWR